MGLGIPNNMGPTVDDYESTFVRLSGREAQGIAILSFCSRHAFVFFVRCEMALLKTGRESLYWAAALYFYPLTC